MGVIAEAKRIKEVHPEYVMFYKVGTFYKVYGKDAYILNSLFDYSISIVKDNVATCGFPIATIIRVRKMMEDLKINYMLIDPRNNYDVDLKEDFRNLNNYQKEFDKAFTTVKRKRIVKKIETELLEKLADPNFKQIIRKIEKIINEAGKI